MTSDKFKTKVEYKNGFTMEVSYIDAAGSKITEREWELFNWSDITTFGDLANTRRWFPMSRREVS